MSGALRKLYAYIAPSDKHKLEPVKRVVEDPLEPVNKPPKLIPGKGPQWKPDEYQFEVPPRPYEWELIRFYWNAHWREVARRFLQPFLDLWALVQSVQSFRKPKRRVTQAFQPAAEWKQGNIEKAYGPLIARALEKEFLQGQTEACRLLSLIITRHAEHSLKKGRLGPLVEGLLDPQGVEERLNSLLPKITQNMHLREFKYADWRTYSGETFEQRFGRDPLVFRERAIGIIAHYLSVMVPVAFDLHKEGKDEGALIEALKERDLLPDQMLGDCLVACLPLTAKRCEGKDRALLLGLAQILDGKAHAIEKSLGELLDKLFSQRAIDSYLFSALKPSQKREKKEMRPRGHGHVLTEVEDAAVHQLVKTVLGKLSGHKRIADYAAKVNHYGGFIGKALKRLIIHENEDQRDCRLDLTMLLPALQLAAEKAKAPKPSENNYGEELDKQLEGDLFLTLRNLRHLLHAYPLLLTNLVRLLLLEAVPFFLTDPEKQ